MKKITLLAILCFLTVGLYAAEKPTEKPVVKPFYQGQVTEVRHGGGYTYLLIKEKTDKTFWIAVSKAEVQNGDQVRFQKELVAKNFTSKALDRSFDEIMFASNLQHKVIK